MLTVIDEKQPNKEPSITLTEAFALISDQLEKLGRPVSPGREHSVETHLRYCIRCMGYRPRETKAKPADIPELARQCQKAIKLLKGIVPKSKRENLSLHLLATVSNLEAEIRDHLSVANEVPEGAEPEIPN